MPSFEEDAFNRAQQMHRRSSYNSNANSNANSNQGSRRSDYSAPKPENPKPEPPENITTEATPVAPQSESGLLDTLFQNKEQSLILLLIVLLIEENSDPTLLLALIYLLM